MNNAYTFYRKYKINPFYWEVNIRCDDIHRTCKRNPSAAAYTLNPGEKRDGYKDISKDTIVICPAIWRTTSTCKKAFDDWHGVERDDIRFNLEYYRCKGRLPIFPFPLPRCRYV